MNERAVTIFLVLQFLVSAPGATELKPGDVLSKDNWQLAQDLLPPEVLKFYEAGEYRTPIVEYPVGRYRRDDSFLAATETYRGQLAVDEIGGIIDKATGKRPPSIEGYPFPDIDPQDPQAAVKILWNHDYYFWGGGNQHQNIELTWLSHNGLDRASVQEVSFLYYDGQPKKYRPPENPNDLLAQMTAVSVAPADMYGTTALTWRFRDAKKRDLVWAYVPALRRARQVSPSNRSDGFLGSDMSQDDGPFFDGKPEDFVWKLVGEKEMFRIIDPLALNPETANKLVSLPRGGWQIVWPEVAIMGFEDPSWKGAPWAPIAGALAKASEWVIEGTPRDRYYLYGKIQLYIDKNTYHGAWNRKFSWQGEVMSSYHVLGWPTSRPLPGVEGEHIESSAVLYRCVYNVKMDRATCPRHARQFGPSEVRAPLSPDAFDYQALMRLGK